MDFRNALTALSLCLTLPALAAEKDYVQAYCEGQIEVVLEDRTRVDCLTETHATEYDFGRKWAEAIGQALHYASHTGRRAGIVLIVESGADERGVKRARNVVSHYGLPIDITVTRPTEGGL